MSASSGRVQNLHVVDGLFFSFAVPASGAEADEPVGTDSTLYPHSRVRAEVAYILFDYGTTQAVVDSVVWRCSERNTRGRCPRMMELQYLVQGAARWTTFSAIASRRVNVQQSWKVSRAEWSGRAVVASRYWRVKVTEGDGNAKAAFDFLELAVSCYTHTGGEYFAKSSIEADLAPGTGGSSPQAGVVLNGALLFLAAPDSIGHLLYRHNPTTARSTSIFREPLLFHTSVAPAKPSSLVLPTLGIAVWAVRGGLLVTDGSEEGTRLHEAPTAERTGRETFVVLSENHAGAEIAYYCDNTAHSRGKVHSSMRSATALCVVSLTSSVGVPAVRKVDTSRGTLARVSSVSFLVSNRGDSGDVVTYFYSSPARETLPQTLGALKSNLCELPYAATTVDATRPSTALSRGFLSISANERGVTGKTALLSFDNVEAWKTVASVHLKLAVLSINFQKATRTSTGGLNTVGSCEMVVVELLSQTYAQNLDTLTYDTLSTAAVLSSMNVSTEAFIGGGAVHIDLTAMMASFATKLDKFVTLRVSIDSDTCTARADPYTIVFAPVWDATPAFRPALCLGSNTVTSIRSNEKKFLSLPKPIALSLRSGVANDVPLDADTWFYGGCGAVALRFKLNAASRGALAAGGQDESYVGGIDFVQPLFDVEVTEGKVSTLPDTFVLRRTGHIALERRRGGNSDVFMSTDPGSASCVYRQPTDADSAFLGFLDNGAAARVSIVDLCNEARCVASGGICAGFSCLCPETMVSLEGDVCECSEGMYGKSCMTYCSAETTCNGRGVCSPSGNCKCDIGFGGASCESTLDCKGVSALFPDAAIQCNRLPDSGVVNNSALVTSDIDECRACIEEGYEVVDGVRRYFCRHTKLP